MPDAAVQTLSASTVSRTSCTLSTRAPRSAASRAAATLGSTRSFTGKGSPLPAGVTAAGETIDPEELTGTVGGLLIETFKITAPDSFGVRRISSDSTTAVSGKGTYGNSLSYYDGDFKLSGKTALIKTQ